MFRTDVEIIPAGPAHVGVIANRMRADDVMECAALGRTPKGALRLGLRASSIAYTAKVDGRPEAMFGLVVSNALCGIGEPWMLGTDAIYRHPREMIALGQMILALFVDSTPTLNNIVSVRNHRALRMLRRWGFTIGKESILHSGVEFVAFTKET